MNAYLQETEFFNYSDPAIQEVVRHHGAPGGTSRERAVALFYFARDAIYYDPYMTTLARESYHASEVLSAGRGYCVTKAVLYAALLRASGIASRIGFADVKNHLTSPRLARVMETDIFYYHGYTEVFLDGRWLKATPAFNKELCERAGTFPLDFDGTQDSIFHPFSKNGARHMEYIRDHGHFADLPYDLILEAFKKYYPTYVSRMAIKADRDFLAEVSRVD